MLCALVVTIHLNCFRALCQDGMNPGLEILGFVCTLALEMSLYFDKWSISSCNLKLYE